MWKMDFLRVILSQKVKDSNTLLRDFQAGTQLSGNGVVVLYTDAQSAEETVTVPDVIGMTAANVNKKIINSGLNLEIVDGNLSMMEGAIAISQNIAPGEKVAPGTVISVRFRHVDGMTD